jgi:acyl-CoA thioesterase-1
MTPHATQAVSGVLLAILAPACARTDPTPPSTTTLLDAPASSPTPAAPAPRLHIPASAPTVAFLGDSIGAGLHLAEHQAFPALLQARLVESGLPFRLVNSCESGRTTSGGVTALDWVLRAKPDVVVIELGGNDGLRGIALEEVEGNLRRMIEGARDFGARVILLGVRLPPNYGDYGAGFEALYSGLAEASGKDELDFVPYFMRGVGAVPEMNLVDGLHPSARGHERLADNVEPALREVLLRIRREASAATEQKE